MPDRARTDAYRSTIPITTTEIDDPGYRSIKGPAISRGALMLGGYLLTSGYCDGHAAGGFGNEYGHGVTGTTAPLLLMASMQFFSISWATRVGFPAVVFPSMHS